MRKKVSSALAAHRRYSAQRQCPGCRCARHRRRSASRSSTHAHGRQHHETLSDQVTSCDDGIVRVGTFGVTRGSRFCARISRTISAAASRTTLTVTRYRVYLNRSRAAASGKGTPPSCTRENTTAGWYDPEETTNFNSPIVVEISATYLGREFEARTVSSPVIEIADASALHSADVASAMSAAMEKANLVLIARVRPGAVGP